MAGFTNVAFWVGIGVSAIMSVVFVRSAVKRRYGRAVGTVIPIAFLGLLLWLVTPFINALLLAFRGKVTGPRGAISVPIGFLGRGAFLRGLRVFGFNCECGVAAWFRHNLRHSPALPHAKFGDHRFGNCEPHLSLSSVHARGSPHTTGHSVVNAGNLFKITWRIDLTQTSTPKIEFSSTSLPENIETKLNKFEQNLALTSYRVDEFRIIHELQYEQFVERRDLELDA